MNLNLDILEKNNSFSWHLFFWNQGFKYQDSGSPLYRNIPERGGGRKVFKLHVTLHLSSAMSDSQRYPLTQSFVLSIECMMWYINHHLSESWLLSFVGSLQNSLTHFCFRNNIEKIVKIKNFKLEKLWYLSHNWTANGLNQAFPRSLDGMSRDNTRQSLKELHSVSYIINYNEYTCKEI